MLWLRMSLLTCTIILVTFMINVSSLAPGDALTTKNRRAIFSTLLSGGASSLIGASILKTTAVNAIDLSTLKPTTATDPSIFLGGPYLDPRNHPGGTRTIELAGTGFGGYQLITVKGGGGRGEPESYELPGMIFQCPGNGQRGGKFCITIDFTPKGGPKDFQGYWDEEQKGIRFVRDNNFWPKQF